MTKVEYQYRYLSQSSLKISDQKPALHLVSSINSPIKTSPVYFSGELLDSRKTALCLLTVSELVAKRFYIPPSMLERILREADPVITVHKASLRFEGLSACCSAYIRLDIDQAYS